MLMFSTQDEQIQKWATCPHETLGWVESVPTRRSVGWNRSP